VGVCLSSHALQNGEGSNPELYGKMVVELLQLHVHACFPVFC